MGNAAEIALPMIALGVVGVATGGFGLAAAGAASGVAGTGAGAVAGAGLGAGASVGTGLGAGLGGGFTSLTIAEVAALPVASTVATTATTATTAATTLGSAAAGSLTSSAGAGLNGVYSAEQIAQLSATGLEGTASEFGFQSFLGEVNSFINSPGFKIAKGAFKAGNQILDNNAAASQRQAAITVSEKNAEVSLANQQLQTEERQRGVQSKLSKALATQRVTANASGINPNVGSAENKVDALFSDADDELDPLAAQGRFLGLKGRANASRFGVRRGVINQSLFSANANSAFGFGASVASAFK
jgi:hypothetical protein